MNYRHIYHAGNPCDVVKHAVLTLLIQTLRLKDKPFALLDTHAGIGLYDLNDERARKTGEAEAGIKRLMLATPAPQLEAYTRVLRAMNPEGGLRFYPGSPMLARQMLRPDDRLILCELHPEDALVLKRLFHGDKQVQTHARDGYEALVALLPPMAKRGLVLIDPPYETPDEFERLVKAVQDIHQRWPQGQVAIWYPIKERPALWRFHEALIAAAIPKILCAEFIDHEESRHDRLNGSGFLFINPPYQFDTQLTQLFSALHQALQSEHKGVVVKWLVGEC